MSGTKRGRKRPRLPWEKTPPAELYRAADIFRTILERFGRDISRAERTASRLIGSEVEFRDYGPGGWAIRYRGEVYHDSDFGQG